MENMSEGKHGEGESQKRITGDRSSSKDKNIRAGFAAHFSAEGDIKLSRSLAGAVIADKDIEASQSSTLAAVAGADITFNNSSSKIAVAGNHLYLQNSHASVIKAGSVVDLVSSHVRVLAGSQFNANETKIGIVLSRQTNLGEGSQVLVNTTQAVVFGSVLGAVFGIIYWLLKREK
jgi:hypothetical protein